MGRAYISDIIGEEYKGWSSENPVVIHAPMGSGKTYFALNVLLKYVQEQGKRLLYVANRSALKTQVECDVPEEYSDSITIVSYQRVANVSLGFIRPSYEEEETEHQKVDRMIRDADYYVFDEAHYFLADTTFNVEIEKCYRKMKTLFEDRKDCICIYMTATLPYLFLLLKESPCVIPYLDSFRLRYYHHRENFMSVKALLSCKEEVDSVVENYQNWVKEKGDIESEEYGERYIWLLHERLADLGDMPTGNFTQTDYYAIRAEKYKKLIEPDDSIKLYRCEPDYSYITPLYFSKWNEIVTAILESPKSEKWLIFVENGEFGAELENLLNGIEENMAVFVSSKKKDKKKSEADKAFTEITKNSKFKQKVLIATKVLDNGINLKDPQLRHVVIDFFEETTFLQMLGRRRLVADDDKIFLYIQNLPEGVVRNKFENRVLQVMMFWHTLLVLKNRPDFTMINPKYYLSRLMNEFYQKYTENGQYISSFGKYLDEENMMYSEFGDRKIKDDKHLLVDLYAPADYAVKKFTYDYYQMMAMFENAYNKRRILGGVEKPYEALIPKVERELQRDQFMWLKAQLDRIGMNDNEHNPIRSEYWLSVWSKRFNLCKKQLEQFLEIHSQGEYLSKDEQEKLKELFLCFIDSIAPPHEDSEKNLKGSLSYINKLLKEFDMPYNVASEQKTINKCQRNWWIIRRV